MYCQKCGTENPEDALFCRNCGNSIKEKKDSIHCLYCKTLNEINAIFCKKCGRRFKEKARIENKKDFDINGFYQEVDGYRISALIFQFVFFSVIAIIYISHFNFLGFGIAVYALIMLFSALRFFYYVGLNIKLKKEEILLMVRKSIYPIFLSNKRLVILTGKKYEISLNLKTDIESVQFWENIWGKKKGLIFNISQNRQLKLQFNNPIIWREKIIELRNLN